MILLIDNYDSFTYNLSQAIESLGEGCVIKRNDEITLDEIETLRPTKIVLSPGPGNPDSAGIVLDVIKHFSGRIPILGVCLGHQAIGQAFGGTVLRAKRPLHGKISPIHHQGGPFFKNVDSPFKAARYHSLVVERASLPSCLIATAETADGEIMALQHREHLTFGVQFHPESIATPAGLRLIENFLSLTSGNSKAA